MKRMKIMGLVALLCALSVCSLAQAMGPEPEVVEIGDKMFIAQSNDVFLNTDEYLDKTIRWQGLYTRYEYLDPDVQPYQIVYRFGPGGCCGDDGMVGFEVAWDGEIPELDSWVEAEGKVELYEEGGVEYLRIGLDSLKVMEERGNEYVSM